MPPQTFDPKKPFTVFDPAKPFTLEQPQTAEKSKKRPPTMQERKIHAEQGTWPADVEPPAMSSSEDLLPLVGGVVGGFTGGIPGAMLGGASGEAARQSIAQLRGREPVRTPAQTAAGIIGEGAIQGATEGTGRAVAWAAGKIAPVLMRSALKPSVDAAMDVNGNGVPKVVQTMLDEGVTVTRGGVKKLYDILEHTGKSVDTKVAQAARYLPQGGGIIPEKVADRALELTKGFVDQVNNAQDLKALADAANQFVLERAGGMRPARAMAVDTAQALKTGTYRSLGNKAFGELKGASVEGQKALASSLKEQIEALVPSVAKDNARYGAVSDALEATARRVGVAGNRDMGGIFWIAHNPAAFLAAQFDRSPAVKSLLAKGLYEQAGKVAQVPPALLRLAMAAIATQPDQVTIPKSSLEIQR